MEEYMAREKKKVPEWQDPVDSPLFPETLAEHYARYKMLISSFSAPHTALLPQHIHILPYCNWFFFRYSYIFNPKPLHYYLLYLKLVRALFFGLGKPLVLQMKVFATSEGNLAWVLLQATHTHRLSRASSHQSVPHPFMHFRALWPVLPQALCGLAYNACLINPELSLETTSFCAPDSQPSVC